MRRSGVRSSSSPPSDGPATSRQVCKSSKSPGDSTLHAVDGPRTARACRLRLADSGAIQWVEQVDGERVVHDIEPGTTFWQRIGITVPSLLPIEWLL